MEKIYLWRWESDLITVSIKKIFSLSLSVLLMLSLFACDRTDNNDIPFEIIDGEQQEENVISEYRVIVSKIGNRFTFASSSTNLFTIHYHLFPNGGGGGSRTPVRNSFNQTSTRVSCL